MGQRLSFLWDYDLSEEDVRRILRQGTPAERAWLIGRILEYAPWEEIWCYLTPQQIARDFESIRFRSPRDRELWEYALQRWLGDRR
ncbi:MAG: hypothetical protein N2556_00860 [Anaerolineae bacterium]|nr:hypothetical protein [Anaerolineae bacterium]